MTASIASDAPARPPMPRALVSRNPLAWIQVFGPGAVIASLTIGTGELIFSSRGGAIFGYAILFPILVLCLLKWTLAYTTARHMVLAGEHPFESWMDLPIGPRGWLPILFFILAVAFIPVWVSFHSSVLGDLLAGMTGTKQYLGGAAIHLWGCGLLIAVFVLAWTGGYARLEKTQLVIVVGMMVSVIATLVLFRPDWLELLRGFVVPQRLEYPEWMLNDARPAVQQIADRPVWVELSLYAGVIGGGGYDYLAYTSYLRDKQWGNAAPALQPDESESVEDDAVQHERDTLDDDTLRQWLRAPLVDCTLSFVVVLIFTTVFVASGKLMLGPAQQIPGDGAFLEHQAQFVTRIHSALYPLYAVAVFLTLLGTLYGTLEVAPVILRETLLAVAPRRRVWGSSQRMRMLAIGWCAGGALIVLAVSFFYQWRMGLEKPPGLTALLVPVNLFTGVFACGMICLLNPWVDERLPTQQRMPVVLKVLNLIGGIAFIVVALRGYYDFAGWWAGGVLAATLAVGLFIAWLWNLVQEPT